MQCIHEIRNTQNLLQSLRNENTVNICIEESQRMLEQIHQDDQDDENETGAGDGAEPQPRI